MTFVFLSERFYKKYDGCQEILQKNTRPYAFLGIKIDGISFAIPIRHHIPHKYAFFTIKSAGLDYTKAVVILDSSDIGKTDVQISRAEWNIIKVNQRKIEHDFASYVKLYKKALNYPNSPHYHFILATSTLQYFKEHL